MIDNWYADYTQEYDRRIEQAAKDLAMLRRERNMLPQVGLTAAIVGDFSESKEYNRIISVGDGVFSKYGENGIVTKLDMEQFEETGNFIDIGVTFVTDDGEEISYGVTRLN